MASLNKQLLTEFIKKFTGYGNYNSPIWFIGMEPGAPQNKKTLEKFFKVWAERRKPEIDDLKISHLQIGEFHYTRFFDDKTKYQSTWGGIIKILFTYTGKTNFDITDVKEYQKNKLGRKNSDHCIMELFPLPSPNMRNDSWRKLYSDIFKNRKEYHSKYLEFRVNKFKKLISKYSPKIVIFYGKNYQKYYEMIIGKKFHPRSKDKKQEIFNLKMKKTKYMLINHPTSFGIKNEYFKKVGQIAKRN